MARTIKVTKEKAMQERAWEAGDKRIKRLKKLKEENQKRAQHIKEGKEGQLKAIRDKKTRETKENANGDEGPERNPEVSEGGQSPHLKGAIPKIGERNCTKMVRGPKTTKFCSSGTARSR